MPILHNNKWRLHPPNRLCFPGFKGLLPGLAHLTLVTALALCLLSSKEAGAATDHLLHGKASWYGTTAHGKLTANGERFNRRGLTAAHKTLPFGTVVRVFNLRNGKQLLLRVTDRGPFIKGRVVDVSMRAAELLNMKDNGIAEVILEAVSNRAGEPLNKENSFYLHLKEERSLLKAMMLAGKLEKRLKQPVRALLSLQDGHLSHAVCLGPYATFKEAERIFGELDQKNIHAKGVIEASTTGGDIPRHVAPYAPPSRKGSAREQRKAEKSGLKNLVYTYLR